jgi:hypothetical protein
VKNLTLTATPTPKPLFDDGESVEDFFYLPLFVFSVYDVPAAQLVATSYTDSAWSRRSLLAPQ